jgi:hypothetical protein
MLPHKTVAQSFCRCFRVTAAAALLIVLPAVAGAQAVPEKPLAKAPVSIEIAARPIPFFDNLEGLDAHIGADGTTVLIMVSDDNFSMIQRTLLLQFGLVD